MEILHERSGLRLYDLRSARWFASSSGVRSPELW